MNRPIIAIAGLTACSGCQLTIFNCEAELVAIAEGFDVSFFPMAETDVSYNGPFTAAFVEGAVSTPGDLETLLDLRARSQHLVAFGTCALWGGIAAMKNHEARQQLSRTVYGAAVSTISSFTPSPLHRFVTVDQTIAGCPPEKYEVLATFAALLGGTKPVFPSYPVCTECRARENSCLLMERNELCLGPLTQAGCNARCPAVRVACEGCRGPVVEANVGAERDLLREKGFSLSEVIGRMRRFCPEWNFEQHA